MANAYTAVPAIIPGPLTVNGLLTVTSDNGIKIGSGPSFVRLFRKSSNLGLSWNVDTDEVTRDLGGFNSQELQFRSTENATLIRQINAAGTVVSTELDRTIAQDGNGTADTGTVAETTLLSKIIPANTLGVDGGFVIDWQVDSGVLTTAATLRLKLGGNTFLSFALAAGAHGGLVRAYFLNAGATNVNRGLGAYFDSAGLNTGTPTITGTDTTADQTLAATAQLTTAGDIITSRGWKVHALVGRDSAL